MNLQGKKVLLITPVFYGYEKEIEQKLQGLGAVVQFVEGHPKEWYGTIMSIAERLGLTRKFFVHIFEDRAYKKFKKGIFDIVIIINSPSITSRLIERIKRNCLVPNSGRMVLYYWDSIDNLKDDRSRWAFFDSIYSFDNYDFEQHKNQLSFLPLFYCDKYWQESDNKPRYDIMVVGSFRLNRYNYIQDIIKENPELRIGTYLYNPKWQIWLHKTFRHKYDNVKYSDLRYKKLTFDEVVSLYMDSVAIFDIPMPGQKGLTIRTIEALAMHKKLITTNHNIVNYDFYNEKNIYVMPRNNSQLPSKEWFDSPFSIENTIIEKYSIGEWLKHLLGD